MAREDITHYDPEITFYPDPNWEGFERAVIFEPGFVDPGPRGPQWCGKGGMKIRFILRGPKGAIQFLMGTDWIPGEKSSPQLADMYPSGWDLGYHALEPQYEGQELGQYGEGSCDYLNGLPCAYDGSGLAADRVLKEFKLRGTPAVWEILKERHDELIKKKK